MISKSHNLPVQLVILLSITALNLGISTSYILDLLPDSVTDYLLALAAIESAVVLLIYKYSRKNAMALQGMHV